MVGLGLESRFPEPRTVCLSVFLLPYSDRVFSVIKDLLSYLGKNEQGLRVLCKFCEECMSRIS